MTALIVTSDARDWPFDISGVDVVDAWTYLTSPEFGNARRTTRVFNLCRSYRYQSTGYYVSLLAEARGHKPLPGVTTLQDLKTRSMIRLVSDELDELIQKSLAPLQSSEFTLSVYFGRNLAQRYDRLSLHLFNQFPVPLLRAEFIKRDETWQIRRIKALSGADVPANHTEFVTEAAQRYFGGRSTSVKVRKRTRFDLAILHDPLEKDNAPSDEAALKKFLKAAEKAEINAELLTKDDFGRLLEFDALFIRETTAVNHHTYRFARRAASEGMIVIDDPVSILRCTNKVYLAELLTRHKIPIPRTVLLHRENADSIAAELGFPCVIKKPDSAFSQGVVKIKSEDELREQLPKFFDESELLVAQEFLPTDFDWRIGVLDNKPLFACRYFMARGHWQIIRQERAGAGRYGKTETVPVELAPRKAVDVAVKAANLIGNGLYGVDVKETANGFHVIEVNDNPNIDAGAEDALLKDELYSRIMDVFVRRIEAAKARNHD
ncbi:RimK family protein [Fuerstiella marisgermanici]|uniref:Alpha-aminoadipate--LysW ligase LysX n=1 Tax=Fuerstiella marisgermanici TaxID=1891926 RepID=A0A1P8WPJ0_9PLAN|nr:RimK family protein [Fuerstiella marisgermanici]APZ95976.1 Alpha-aminoadipate--LysW ligase LysX [Fuerstiella marisgermanici]